MHLLSWIAVIEGSPLGLPDYWDGRLAQAPGPRRRERAPGRARGRPHRRGRFSQGQALPLVHQFPVHPRRRLARVREGENVTPDEYQQLALRTENKRTFDLNERTAQLMHGVIGACTEVGELQDQVKRHLFYGKPHDEVNVVEEVGDALWYLAVTLDAVGATMGDCMARNIAKLRVRYPDKFSSERALARDLDKEREALVFGRPPGSRGVKREQLGDDPPTFVLSFGSVGVRLRQEEAERLFAMLRTQLVGTEP